MNEAMLAAFRHDAHKFAGESHDNAPETFCGVSVNRTVPMGADSDAGVLSRPQQRQTQTVPTHHNHSRLSLLTGEPVANVEQAPRETIRELLAVGSVSTAHERWLASDVAALFNESVYHPYTSLKYHTLLVAALLDNYRDGHDFADCRLVVDPGGVVVPCRTVLEASRFALRIDANDHDRPSARLGSRPWQSWASVWNRLPAHPLKTDRETFDMVLDANLRRIGAWSTALQYIEDFEGWDATPSEPRE